jgi:hypothetical protein
VFSWIQKGRLVAPFMTPRALLFLNMGFVTPLYSRLELPWRAASLQRLNGFSMSVAVSRVCPQGGELSPLLRCLVVNLIARLNGVEYILKATRWHVF